MPDHRRKTAVQLAATGFLANAQSTHRHADWRPFQPERSLTIVAIPQTSRDRAAPSVTRGRPADHPCRSGRTLRLLVISDLAGAPPPRGPMPEDVDIIAAAGDLTDSALGTLSLLRSTFPAPMPLVAVLGDREYRSAEMGRTLDQARRMARRHRIHLLEHHACFIGGIRFLGATLWTDFRLHADAAAARTVAEATFADLDIRNVDKSRLDPFRSTGLHWCSRTWLGLTLTIPHDGPTVVVTHHAPTGYGHSMVPFVEPLAPARASHCDDLVRSSGAAVWIHGGPEACDHVVGCTRVLANPAAGAAQWATLQVGQSGGVALTDPPYCAETGTVSGSRPVCADGDRRPLRKPARITADYAGQKARTPPSA